MDIDILLTNFKKSLQEAQGLSPSSIKHNYEPALKFISRCYSDNMLGEKFDSDFLLNCFKKMSKLYSAGKIPEARFKRYRKCISSLRQFMDCRIISYERLPALSFRVPTDESERLLQQFLEFERPRLADTSRDLCPSV